MAYQQDQARDDHGRWASGGQGPSQAKAERVALNQRLDARNRSLTYGFGPAARALENKPAPAAHQAAVHRATAGKSLGGGGGGGGGGRSGGGGRFSATPKRKPKFQVLKGGTP